MVKSQLTDGLRRWICSIRLKEGKETHLAETWSEGVTGEHHWLTLVFTLRAEVLSCSGFRNLVAKVSLGMMGALLGHLLLNVLQEITVGRSHVRLVLHQVLEQSGFS